MTAARASLWFFDLDQIQVAACLSPDEQKRADRFKFERDRRRFINGRTALRMILSNVLGREPQSLQFEYGPAGKPSLPNIFFNLAHTGPHALLAVCDFARIGADIEEVASLEDLNDLAKSVFASGELRRWQSLPPSERAPAFYRIWTRKEAYLKAIGEGIAHRLQKFEVTFETGEQPRIILGAEGVWTLADVSPSPQLAAAIAVEAPAIKVQIEKLPFG